MSEIKNVLLKIYCVCVH